MILSPIRILCGASDWRSAWASVLQAMNSTPIISARIIRLTALLPPPPTPMTRISAKFSESDRNAIVFLRGWSRGDGPSGRDGDRRVIACGATRRTPQRLRSSGPSGWPGVYHRAVAIGQPESRPPAASSTSGAGRRVRAIRCPRRTDRRPADAERRR